MDQNISGSGSHTPPPPDLGKRVCFQQEPEGASNSEETKANKQFLSFRFHIQPFFLSLSFSTDDKNLLNAEEMSDGSKQQRRGCFHLRLSVAALLHFLFPRIKVTFKKHFFHLWTISVNVRQIKWEYLTPIKRHQCNQVGNKRPTPSRPPLCSASDWWRTSIIKKCSKRRRPHLNRAHVKLYLITRVNRARVCLLTAESSPQGAPL